MSAMRGPRSQVGNASWIVDERSFASKIVNSEVEEFSYSARNELDWLNEHMAGIFDENETNLAETFKTPGKLRGKTPRTGRRPNELERVVSRFDSRIIGWKIDKEKPLSDVFSAKPREPLTLASPTRETGIPRSPARLLLSRLTASPAKQPNPLPPVQDSGYFGSQDVASLDVQHDLRPGNSQQLLRGEEDPCTPAMIPQRSPCRAAVPELHNEAEHTEEPPADSEENEAMPCSDDTRETQQESNENINATPPSTLEPHPDPNATEKGAASQTQEAEAQASQPEQVSDDGRSPSDGSSPIRPVVRKSSLTFASLPAREPLTAGKKMSVGTRASRTSHLDNIRTSYYNRPTGGKSLGNTTKADEDEMATGDEMGTDGEHSAKAADEQSNVPLNHTKTYTQRLQAQINLLGQSNVQPLQQHKLTATKTVSIKESTAVQSTPGAFPDPDDNGDDDDWIEPPASVAGTANGIPAFSKSRSADVMEAIQGKSTIGQEDFEAPERRADEDPKDGGAEQQVSRLLEHTDEASEKAVAETQLALDADSQSPQLAVSVSNPEMRDATERGRLYTPSKSPSRTFRDSPLKQVKNKLSSILKSSRGLLASSAAVSAEGKSSIMSPAAIRPVLHPTTSAESVVSKSHDELPDSHSQDEQPGSPGRPIARRTRASTEREKEEKRREKEAKRIEAQNDKLEKAREREREKALVFSREQERIAAMERQISSKKAEGKAASKETPKPTRSSPRRAKAVESEPNEDVEMEDAPVVPPQQSSAPHSFGPGRNKETKRPVRPAKEALAKAKQAPTVIRVNTGSQHSQFHTTNRLSTVSHDTTGSSSLQPQNRLLGKSSKASLHSKSSTSSMRAPSSVNRPRTLDLATKKKELEEREAQRRREARAETERKRAEEDQQKQERLRRQEADRQKQQHGSELAAEGKTPAERRAVLEKAKQTRAPPPAPRSQPNGPPEAQEKSASTIRGEAARQQSRVASTLLRSQEEQTRPVNGLLSSTTKSGVKRGLGTDRSDDNQAKRPPSRGGFSYQANEAKRRRTSDTFDDDAEIDHSRNIKGPPVRPSGGFKKDLAPKTMYGYTSASHSASRDLFKATVTAQHHGQTKAAHPLDMAQISKGGIPFAPNTNHGGAAYKTPARPGANPGAKSAAKSAARSSPRFQNGESIELPEIQTDDDDDDDDDDEGNGMNVAAWADSPDLRRALMRQETMDPSQIFGPPAPLNMEEVFNKSKERWHKFRARTSSANWAGADRLTEEDIRRDLAARDKLRREGGWSYEMSREMV
ncbi:hypothetical protein L249_4027 [Ophiocordyceps polyrhachis-furcata BCC 54312]|uniref:Inner centromere protein ARK-binding domain-containing protein n=1 Tax=Ophiocordyceps polyrhachis-furcata BCC 54312 TaxID=1330021 RepID=A0A367L586_9HYPO|nr:hypothetical protein L249_4027 [Ophiocordyceps polyrhachis-furcata BCC 54312]